MKKCGKIGVLLLAGLLASACQSRLGSSVAEVIGGGALPKSEGSIFDGLGKGREHRAAETVGEDGEMSYRSDDGPGYFGRKHRFGRPRAEADLAPSFAADGTCLHCNGRGFRFSSDRSVRDYVGCSGCDGEGRR